MLIAALMFQDPEWGRAVAAASARVDMGLKPGLTGAQRETCAQAYDRIGYWEGQRPALEAQAADLALMRGQAATTPVSSEAERDWRDASLRISDALAEQIQQALTDGNRTAHALQGEVLVFCADL